MKRHRWVGVGLGVLLVGGVVAARSVRAQRPPVAPATLTLRLGPFEGIRVYRVIFSADGREGSRAIRLFRGFDDQSPLLYKQCSTQAVMDGTLTATGEGGEEVYRLNLKGARIAGIETNSGEAERPSETLTIQAGTLELRAGPNTAVIGAAR